MREYIPQIIRNYDNVRTIKLQIGVDRVLFAEIDGNVIASAGVTSNDCFHEVGGCHMLDVAIKQNRRFNRFVDIVKKDIENWKNKTGIYTE